MARGPGKARDFDYSNVGKTGRRTGISLKEGRRDEHGMEEVDGLFSSPEKSPAALPTFEENAASSGSDEMSMDEGNAPGPMDFLKSANGPRTSFLSPSAARSPIKAGLTRSPHGSALRSTPELQDIHESSSPYDNRSASAEENSPPEPSPLSTRSVNAGRFNQKNGTWKTKAQIVAESEPSVLPDFSDGDGDENDENDNNDENDENSGLQQEYGTGFEDPRAGAEEPTQNGPEDVSIIDLAPPRTDETTTSKANKGASKNAKPDQPSAKPRGRPPKTQRRDGDGDVDTRPTKRQMTAKVAPAAREPLEPELDRVVDNYANRTGPLKGRSLYILKRENPEDTSATHTRSGRVSVRPLAYWRNERCVFGDGEVAEGHRYPLSTIKEVIRTEEQEPEKKKSKRGRKSKSKKSKNDSSDEEDEDADLWEQEGGVLHGYVQMWDSKTQASSREEEVLDVAYAPSGIETREVKGSSFRFAKLLSGTFIGSGVVELPPKGVKKPKNSKRMHMVFYVCHGRVQVDISGIQFSAGKGCVFQVPRGNYYSFANIHSKEVRLFFTQGQLPEEDENDTQPTTPEGGTESENETETASAAPVAVKKTKGRPKGKGKKNEKPPTPEAGSESENEAESPAAAPPSHPVKKAKGRPRGKQKKTGK
ncbi:uncharacterized protein N7511_000956 [Penicillium nucicola]|uniref:uncharacterized protein n=1 Tax=Penicillium nucicola TaxID=1850975 RepID=UPI002545BAD2|nr:uncharacterized protein N7511_000956 [Penicillium nucicola]KAJ5775945.1 hypothetical protein N7511_000956 [Penicillium nucicola]